MSESDNCECGHALRSHAPFNTGGQPCAECACADFNIPIVHEKTEGGRLRRPGGCED